MSKGLLKLMLAANLTVLGGAFVGTTLGAPAPAKDSVAGQPVKQVKAYELLSTGHVIVADRAERGDCQVGGLTDC